jgi:hypothetical protein
MFNWFQTVNDYLSHYLTGRGDTEFNVIGTVIGIEFLIPSRCCVRVFVMRPSPKGKNKATWVPTRCK